MTLELLNPTGLWLLTALAPLIVFYILKVKRQRTRVASVWLWSTARRDLLAKQPFRRLIAELPLILQVLAIIALSLAFARPAMRGGSIDGDHVAIILDTSASMGTRMGEGPATRMSEAKKAAHEALLSLAPGADVIVLEAARDGRVTAPLSHDERQWSAAIDRAVARDVEGDLSEAVALAADRLRSLDGVKRIVLITDGALAHDAPLTTQGLDLDVVRVGDEQDNAGIVRVDVRSGQDRETKREQVQVFAMVEELAANARDVYVTVTVEGKADPLASRRVLVPANEKLPVVLTFEPTSEDRGQGLIVALSPNDALAADDVAYARVPQAARMPVTLATDQSRSWLGRALEADPETDLQRLTLAQLARVNIDPEALVVVEAPARRSPRGGTSSWSPLPRAACVWGSRSLRRSSTRRSPPGSTATRASAS